MSARILESTPFSRTVLHTHADGTLTVQKKTDVTALVDRAKGLHNSGKHQTKMGDKHAASVPIPVLVEWLQKRGKTFADWAQDRSLVKQFLEDPDNNVFRIWKGQL